MSHAWLITGPPGSGRSNAARAFAAALQCEDGGCGAVHQLPLLAERGASRCDPGAHRAALHRGGRGPRTGPPGGDEPDAGPLAGDRGRGRRPGDRARRRRPAEEHRGARSAYGLDPLRSDARRRGGDRPVALPAASTADAQLGGGQPAAADPRRDRSRARGVRGPGGARPRRPGASAGSRLRCPGTPGPGAADSAAAERAGRLPQCRRPAGRGQRSGGQRGHRRPRCPRTGRAHRGAWVSGPRGRDPARPRPR